MEGSGITQVPVPRETDRPYARTRKPCKTGAACSRFVTPRPSGHHVITANRPSTSSDGTRVPSTIAPNVPFPVPALTPYRLWLEEGAESRAEAGAATGLGSPSPALRELSGTEQPFTIPRVILSSHTLPHRIHDTLSLSLSLWRTSTPRTGSAHNARGHPAAPHGAAAPTHPPCAE